MLLILQTHPLITYIQYGTKKIMNLINTFKKKGWKCQGYELSKWIKNKDVVYDINKINKKNNKVLVFNDVLEHVSDPLLFLKRFSKFQTKGDKLFKKQ